MSGITCSARGCRGRVWGSLLWGYYIPIWLVSWSVCAEAAPSPIYTNKQRFRIPYRYDAQALQRAQPRELQLYVSTNKGASWTLQQVIAPHEGRFEYQARSDGEFWFAVRMTDPMGRRLVEELRFEPGLIVIVDTMPPEFKLHLDSPAAGKVLLQWDAVDDHLDVTSLRLEYQQLGVNTWQAVGVVPKPSGETTWTIPEGGTITVRGIIADLAGNQVVRQAEIQVPPSREVQTVPNPSYKEPIARNFGDRQGQESEGKSLLNSGSMPLPTPLPIIRPAPVSETMNFRPEMMAVGDRPESRPSVMQPRWPQESASSASRSLYSASQPKLLGARKFFLNYQVDHVGPSGVGEVEIYITEDAGKTWYRYGNDADHQSPAEIVVPGDGSYGFMIRVLSGVGLGESPPQPGEPPRLVVTVDQTPPILEDLEIVQGVSTNGMELTLHWKYSDPHPADKRVSVAMSTSPQGPWQVISDWAAHDGVFRWKVPPGAPSQLFFRISAQDALGNVSHLETQQPVVIDFIKPRVRILDAEAMPSTTQKP